MDICDFSLDLFSLAGRNALVTGGNTGLGRAFSAALATAGADVFAVGLAEDDGRPRQPSRLCPPTSRSGGGRMARAYRVAGVEAGAPGGDTADRDD